MKEVAILLLRVPIQHIYKLVHTNPTGARICLVMTMFYRAVIISLHQLVQNELQTFCIMSSFAPATGGRKCAWSTAVFPQVPCTVPATW